MHLGARNKNLANTPHRACTKIIWTKTLQYTIQWIQERLCSFFPFFFFCNLECQFYFQYHFLFSQWILKCLQKLKTWKIELYDWEFLTASKHLDQIAQTLFTLELNKGWNTAILQLINHSSFYWLKKNNTIYYWQDHGHVVIERRAHEQLHKSSTIFFRNGLTQDPHELSFITGLSTF